MENNFSNIKDRILKVAETYKVSKEKFFEELDISYGNFKGSAKKTPINSLFLENLLTKYPELSAEWLVTGRGPMLRNDTTVAQRTTELGAGIPLIPIEAIAGIPAGEDIGIRFIDCTRYVIPEFANLNVEYMVRVSGSSMYPKYSNGDVLACRRIQDVLFFQWGKIYVIDSSQGPLVKRVFQDEDPDRILLVSDNKEHYPPFSIPKSDIRSLSIVLGVIRLE
jgi:phage repressor protein C with HTH and peptisase S24 domain